MKKLLVIAAAAAVVLSSCGTGGGAPKTEMDSMAYCLGLDIGQSIKGIDSTINVAMLAQGIKDQLTSKKGGMSMDSAYAFLQEYFQVRKPKRALLDSEAYLAKVEKDTKGIQKTSSGLLYLIENPGNDVKPASDSTKVRVLYEGKLPNGKVFDSTQERGDTATFALNQVIKGWGEGLKLIGEGGKIKLWLHPDIAYGARGAGQDIGPNQAIEFDVELIEVVK